jgi:hypothetical protein
MIRNRCSGLFFLDLQLAALVHLDPACIHFGGIEKKLPYWKKSAVHLSWYSGLIPAKQVGWHCRPIEPAAKKKNNNREGSYARLRGFKDATMIKKEWSLNSS